VRRELRSDPCSDPSPHSLESPHSDEFGAWDFGTWHGATRILFRICFCYLALYALYTFSLLIALVVRDLGGKQPFFPVEAGLHGVVPWVGRHLLGIRQPIDLRNGFSADGLFDWVEHFCFGATALIGALIWSVLDGKRTDYRRLHAWLNLFLRLTLAATMFSYGFDKVFPLQFHSITRMDLVQLLGKLNHEQLMWRFMASSPGYTIFSGSLEVLGGIFLLIPRLSNLGAILCALVLSNVVALNIAYNVTVKLFSFNLLLMAIFLAAPEIPRLARILVLNRPAFPMRRVPLAERKWIDKGARILQAALGVCFFMICLVDDASRYTRIQRASAVAVPLQGIWTVDEFSVSGEPEHTLFNQALAHDMHVGTGDDRWARLVFDRPGVARIQIRNGEVDYIAIKLDKTVTTAELSDDGDPDWKGKLTIERPQPNLLNLTGVVNGVNVSARLHRMDESQFDLKNEKVSLFSNAGSVMSARIQRTDIS
jgi:uncharacterized membrane protein YphA (DoxX/SURF4 family)